MKFLGLFIVLSLTTNLALAEKPATKVSHDKEHHHSGTPDHEHDEAHHKVHDHKAHHPDHDPSKEVGEERTFFEKKEIIRVF